MDVLHKVVVQSSNLWVFRPMIHELKGAQHWSVVTQATESNLLIK